MNMFSVDDAASGEIRRIFGQSKCRDPVVEVIGIGYPADGEDKVRAIRILVQERSDIPPAELCEVSGIVFARGTVEAFPDFCLTFDSERILLRGPNRQLHTSLESA